MSATGNTAGFTLIEMLVVLAILGLIGGLGYPRLQQAVRAQEFRTAGSGIAAALREARARAVRTARPVRFTATADGSAVGDDGGARLQLPGAVVATVTPIIFYPDGSSNGGSARVADGTRRLRYDIAPATGLFRISVQ